MARLTLDTLDNQTAFRPGETIRGVAGWELDEPPRDAEVRLFWRTEGIGTQDVSVVHKLDLPVNQAVDAHAYELQAPDGPYSCAGKLVSILWAVELVVDPGDHVQRIDISISPTGEPVQLNHSVAEASETA